MCESARLDLSLTIESDSIKMKIDEEVAKRLQKITDGVDPLTQTTGDLACGEYVLDCLFYAGRGRPMDKSRAVSYFKSAADRGHT
jgi:hypothetical protein